MRISYRAVSSVVVSILVLLLTMEFLLDKLRVPATTVGETGIVQFDTCVMWEQIPASVRLSTFVWCGSFLVLLIQGLRNRSAPWWLAVMCLVALGSMLSHDYWRLQHCYTKLGIAGFWIWTSAVSLMCLHQILQRHPITKKAAQTSRPKEKEE